MPIAPARVRSTRFPKIGFRLRLLEIVRRRGDARVIALNECLLPGTQIAGLSAWVWAEAAAALPAASPMSGTRTRQTNSPSRLAHADRVRDLSEDSRVTYVGKWLIASAPHTFCQADTDAARCRIPIS